MSESSESEELLQSLRIAVSSYLENRVSKPALETVTKNLTGQARVANLTVLIRALFEEARACGLDYDRDFLTSLPTGEIEARIKVLCEVAESKDGANPRTRDVLQSAARYLASDTSRKYLLEYVERELNWIVVSTLSASYVSALILMRSVLELLVGIATRTTGKMRVRVDSVACLDGTEKKRLNRLWTRLCGWSHPYAKWITEVCPVYSGHAPTYHRRLFGLCLDELLELTDLLASVVVAKYELEPARLGVRFNQERIALTEFRSLSKRLLAEPSAAPNGGPATQLGDSGVTEGPPSVS